MSRTIQAPAVAPEIVTLEERHVAATPVHGSTTQLPALLAEAFEATMRQISASGGQVAGPPFARYFAFGLRIDAEAGFPCAGPLTATERVHATVLPGGRAVVETHVGPYEEIGSVWHQVEAWIREHGFVQASTPWESYLTGPDDPGPPVTQIVFPIR